MSYQEERREEVRKKIREETLKDTKKKIDVITVKVYEMAMGSAKRGIYDESIVRKDTLEWAREALLALILGKGK